MQIELHNVHKTYEGAQPLHVLKGIDLSIDKGEFVSIMGASGSGKSTLLNILGILDTYDEGEYIIDGRLIKGLSERAAAGYRNRTIGSNRSTSSVSRLPWRMWNCRCSTKASAVAVGTSWPWNIWTAWD